MADILHRAVRIQQRTSLRVEQGSELAKAVVVLAAGVVAVPLFKRLGLGSVLGYLAGGLAVGPFGLGFFSEAQTILHIAEVGVVMFLFVIGLEMQPSRLWNLRRQIFGMGVAQVAVCGALLTAAGVAAGFGTPVAFVAEMGFVLSSTAIVMQMLDERGDTSTARGQRIVSVLLLEDLAIVPLLAAVALLAPEVPGAEAGWRWVQVGVGLVAIVGRLPSRCAAGSATRRSCPTCTTCRRRPTSPAAATARRAAC